MRTHPKYGTHKHCVDCDKDLPISEFYKHRDGLTFRCKQCHTVRFYTPAYKKKAKLTQAKKTAHLATPEGKKAMDVWRARMKANTLTTRPYTYKLVFTDGTWYIGSTQSLWHIRAAAHVQICSPVGRKLVESCLASFEQLFFDTKEDAILHEEYLIKLDDPLCLNKVRARIC